MMVDRCEPAVAWYGRPSAQERDERKRKREAALVSFDRNGSFDGMASLAITDFAPPGAAASGPEPFAATRPPPTPGKGILKPRPILKGAQQERHKSKSPKKRKVAFDEKTLEELQKEKEHEPPKRKVDEHNTPYHDTYPRVACGEDEYPDGEVRRPQPPSPKEGHLHFHFNVQFNFTKPKVKSKIFREKTKELILEEGQMFKLMVKAKLPEPDDMEDDDLANGQSIEQMLREANLPAPSYWAHLSGSPNTDETSSLLDPLSPSSLSRPDAYPGSPNVLLMPPPFHFHHAADEPPQPTAAPLAGDVGSPASSTDAFVFTAPPSAITRCRSFTYCSGEAG